MDFVFIVDSYRSGFQRIALFSAALITINIIFNSYFAAKNMKKYIKTKNDHNTAFINCVTKFALSVELHSIGVTLDRFSTSSATSQFGVEVP